MNNEQLLRFLQSTKLVSLQTAEEISRSFTWKEIPKNTLFVKQGRISNEYLFLQNGFMRAFAYDTEGNDVTTGFYPGNGVVFEVSSFFNRIPSKENIEAVSDCEGWVTTYDQLNTLFHSLPEFREFGRMMLVRGYASLKTRMLVMITETAEQRYTGLLQTHPEIFRNAPLKHIASYLGITDTSLSRIRKEFSRK
ncbi:MAG TPA: Crp/Fnr family transcriptional regulator [Flavitalea sp.]|nr:Crp/Fnr family transcriptional regulator [Flavitalea sp.]